MLRSLLCGLWPRSRPKCRSAEEIQNDLRGSLAERRHLAEKIVEDGEVRAELASKLNGLAEEFERRLHVASSGPGLVENTKEEIFKKCWSGEELPWYGPSPADVSLALLESQHRLTIRCENLEAVHQRVCSLQDEFTEAVKKHENQDLRFGREQMDAEMFLPPEPLKTIQEVHYCTASVSGEPNVSNCDDKMIAARLKFQASSARCRQAAKEFDQRLIEPMQKRFPYYIAPPQDSCLQDDRAKTQYLANLQLRVAGKKARILLVPEESQEEMIAPVEYATLLVSVVSPVEYTIASISVPTSVRLVTKSVSVAVTDDHAPGSGQNVIDWDAKMDAARCKFQASSAHCRQAVMNFDQRLIEPMKKGFPFYVEPPQDSCLQDKRIETEYEVHPQLHVAGKKVPPGLFLPEESEEEVIAPVEDAIASISVSTLVTSVSESVSVSAPVDRASGSELSVSTAMPRWLRLIRRLKQLAHVRNNH